MLGEKMYVRCPADPQSMINPRVFVCGQVLKIDKFKKTIKVRFYDPFQYRLFFDNLPKGTVEFLEDRVKHCKLFIGTEVIYKEKVCRIITDQEAEDGYYNYYIQEKKSKRVLLVSERDIIASLTNGRIDPAQQLKQYEFQNPSWFFGHAIVSRSMNILENSIYGFKDLAGSKIYLFPHQINTIMRCLQEMPCRYMLADEVGMGKTVEAISVMKIYMQNRTNLKALIIVPSALKEQWRTELLLKFNIPIGIGNDNNSVIIKSINEIGDIELNWEWDFVIIDEVHRYLQNKYSYSVLHTVSSNAKNILLLSATPVQQRKEEYLDLLRLLQPRKYDSYNIEQFGSLVNKQGKIIQRTALILDDLADLEEEYENSIKSNVNPHDSVDCKDLYDEVYNGLEEICEELNDIKLRQIFNEIQFEENDLGIYRIKVLISFICSNYQIESNIIRNRRKILENSDDGKRLLPDRKLTAISYSLDKDKNTYESICYQLLTDWCLQNANIIDVEAIIKPLLSAFFSSPWAFRAMLNRGPIKQAFRDANLLFNVINWEKFEDEILRNLPDILDDPGAYEEECSTRIVTVLNFLYEELFNAKVILFTNYAETFNAYHDALNKVFGDEVCSFFGASIESSELELNAYKFQNESTCRIMLCDYTGGEGRNFQCADYIIHIDLPWDASIIEQRIGRLDRLERDMSRPIVNSVVVYTVETFENALFNFWSKGLNIFNQSLSGMEIIMQEINQQIISAIKNDFKYGLAAKIPALIELTAKMREVIRKEQNYDAASFIFRPMFAELKRLTDYFARNENTLFANTMINWASLAGFHGHGGKGTGILTYDSRSFSPKSAINSQLIPPNWNVYLKTVQNQFVNSVEEAYNKKRKRINQSGAIKGTFVRQLAIENDYLHFFAPGDLLFDCIVNNAMQSCKGCASAFAIETKMNWKGLIFTWTLAPNEAFLLEHGISVYTLSSYRNYLLSEQVVVPISIENNDSYNDEVIVRSYLQIINSGFQKANLVHLGKRTLDAKFLKNIITDINIDWFKKVYFEERWEEIIEASREEAYNKAKEQFKRRYNIRGVKEEMERLLSAREANSVYYGVTDERIEEMKRQQNLIFEAIKNPIINLDSAAFVWMVDINNG